MENSNALIKILESSYFSHQNLVFEIFIHVRSRDVILKHKFMIIFEEFYLKK